MPTNREIAKILNEIAVYLEMDAIPFKPRAYEKAAETISDMGEELGDIYTEGGIKALLEIEGVGRAIAEKIEELVKTGRLKYYEALKKKIPVDISGLRAVESVGPKHIKVFWDKLKVKTLDDLEKAAKAGKIGVLPHFGKRSEEKILKGIAALRQHSGHFSIFEALPVAYSIEAQLGKLNGVEKITVAGSLRRWKETIGDIDILVIAKKAAPVMDAFVNLKGVAEVLGHGETKSSVKLHSGMNVDLRVVPPESFGAALNYFTGSKSHNVALRQIAIEQGYKLNEYGVFKGTKRIAGKDEEGVYKALGLRYIPPELREETGEIKAAKKGTLPNLITLNDIRGDLQTQTDWTDGKHSIEAMAETARRLGWEYIAVTDHTKNLAMTGGSDEKRLRKQMKEIDRLNRKMRGFKILKSAEVDILKDGSLDIADEVLAELDVVGISVHTYFNLPAAEQTRRIIRAMENPHADILFHPTGRIVGKRDPFDVDMDEIIQAAKRTRTVLEVNGSMRLDLKDEYVRKALAAGVKLAVDTDAHAVENFSWMEYGVAQARRGWAEKKDVVNAMSGDMLQRFFAKPKRSR